MDNTKSAESPLEETEASGSHVTAAFEQLNNEIRLSILLALWEVYDPYGTNEPVSFSELYDSVPVGDSANFTYHLDKLTDHFVEKTDDGYKLRNAGMMIVRAIIAGAGFEESTISPTELEFSCHRCGEGRVEISYEDEAVHLTCLDCDGFTTAEDQPPGTIGKFWLDPAGLADRQPQELLTASVIRTENRNRMMKQGVCPACSGTIETSLHLCEEHKPESGAVCPNCGRRDSVRVRYVCTVCKNRNRRPVELTVIDHPEFIAFYDDHDIDLRWDIDDSDECLHLMKHMWAMEHSLISTDPVRIRVTAPCDGDELELLLDEELNIIDVSQSS
jgi:hypothetical protein